MNPDGSLDPSFNRTGIATLKLPDPYATATAMAIQPDGKILLGGFSGLSNYSGHGAVARFNGDGSEDVAFNTAVAPTATAGSAVKAIGVDSDGRIVVGASWSNHPGLARFNENGSLDSTFGTDGGIVAATSGTGTDADLTIGADDSVIVGGYSNRNTSNLNDLFVAKFTAAGLPDSSFGNGGSTFVDFNHNDETMISMGLTSTGKILIGCYSRLNSGPATSRLVRLTSSGGLDASFSPGGALTVPGFWVDYAVGPDDTVSAITTVFTPDTSGDEFYTTRFLSTGATDTAFGTNGYQLIRFLTPTQSTANAVAIQPDGKVLVAGSAEILANPRGFESGQGLILARFNTDGTPDMTFGDGGKVPTYLGASDNASAPPGNVYKSLVLQPDGMIVAASAYGIRRFLPNGQPDNDFGANGTIQLPRFFPGVLLGLHVGGNLIAASKANSTQFGVYELDLARVSPAGIFDSTFGTNGIARLSFGPTDFTLKALSVDALGRIVVTGASVTTGSTTNLRVARFTASGAVDSSFGGGTGFVQFATSSISSGNAIAIQPDGKIAVAAGLNAGGLALVRLNDDGSLDPSFGTGGLTTTVYGLAIQATSIRVLADGSIDIAGGNDSIGKLAHYSAAGALDQGFGVGGSVTFGDAAAGPMSLNAMAVRPDGKVVLVGSLNKTLMVGQVAGYVPDVVAMAPSGEGLVLRQSADHLHIDWTMGTLAGQIPIDHAAGLTLNGVGGATISLDYNRGNPLPNILHLNGTFAINGLSGADALAGTTLDIGSSTMLVGYDPAANTAPMIQQSLKNGYNAGGWNGVAGPANGVITSSLAASGQFGKFGVGFADSADGLVTGLPANTIEVRYTVMGDANLDGTVSSADAITLARNYPATGSPAWSLGNFNYDAVIDTADAAILQKNYNLSVPTSPASAPASTSTVLVQQPPDQPPQPPQGFLYQPDDSDSQRVPGKTKVKGRFGDESRHAPTRRR